MKKTIFAVVVMALLSGCGASNQQRAAWSAKSNAQVIQCAAESQNIPTGNGAGLVSAALSGRKYDACYGEFNRRVNSGQISEQEYMMYAAMTNKQTINVNANVNHTW